MLKKVNKMVFNKKVFNKQNSKRKSYNSIGQNQKKKLEFQEKEQKKIQERCDFLKKYFKFDHFFEVKGYSSYQLKITYFGKKKKVWNTNIELCFENYLDCQDLFLRLKGECVETPLRLRKSIFDLKILLVEEIYREEIYIENQSTNTMKVQVHIPKDLKKILVFNPQFSFLGSNSFFKFPLKIIIPQNYQSKLKIIMIRRVSFPINIVSWPLLLVPSKLCMFLLKSFSEFLRNH
jgi:hypothetical protein